MESTGGRTGEQLTFAGVPAPGRTRPPRRASEPLAERLPVATVLVDRPQAHLDRPFEYAVPAALDEAAKPGVRVKVRFGGQDLDGYVVGRHDDAEHEGDLVPVRRVVSAEVVLRPEVLALARAVARRYVGTLADVLRLAVPPRHARVEQEDWTSPGPAPAPGQVSGPELGPAAGPWSDHIGGEAFLRRVAAGEAPRAVWQALPGPPGAGWSDAIAAAVLAARAGGRGALVVLPSAAEVTILERGLLAAGAGPWQPGRPGGWVRLMADDGPAARYRSFLALSRGQADVAIGTRAAAFAPVNEPGLLVCWDDGDALLAEPRAPYPHARDVLALRSDQSGAALLVGGYSRTVATQRWVSTGWAHALVAPRDVVRRRTPRVSALTSVELASEGAAGAARLPGAAWRAVRDGLTRGPVLVQVPRAGYVPSVACQECRAIARCADCNGPLHVPSRGGTPQCRWCGRLAAGWRCPECSSTRLRSVRIGSDRTAEELGRAFPGHLVRVSGSTASGGVLAAVGASPALVIATPGAEPVAEGGYAAALILDAAVTTSRAALDVGDQALRSWLNAAALVRPGPDGVVLLVGDGAPAPSQALVRWDPAGFAERELIERAELQLPPAVHLVSVEGPREAVERLLALVELPAGSSVLGPMSTEQRHPDAQDRAGRTQAPAMLDPEPMRPVRALVRSPWASAPEVTSRLGAAVAVRSARREPGSVRVEAEPLDVS